MATVAPIGSTRPLKHCSAAARSPASIAADPRSDLVCLLVFEEVREAILYDPIPAVDVPSRLIALDTKISRYDVRNAMLSIPQRAEIAL
jgi:hypothetical protein